VLRPAGALAPSLAAGARRPAGDAKPRRARAQALLDAWRAEAARKPLAMSEADACAALELEPGADGGRVSEEALRGAYRRLARRWHPDRNPAGRERFQAVQAAYERLQAGAAAGQGPQPWRLLLLLRARARPPAPPDSLPTPSRAARRTRTLVSLPSRRAAARAGAAGVGSARRALREGGCHGRQAGAGRWAWSGRAPGGCPRHRQGRLQGALQYPAGAGQCVCRVGAAGRAGNAHRI